MVPSFPRGERRPQRKPKPVGLPFCRQSQNRCSGSRGPERAAPCLPSPAGGRGTEARARSRPMPAHPTHLLFFRLLPLGRSRLLLPFERGRDAVVDVEGDGDPAQGEAQAP